MKGAFWHVLQTFLVSIIIIIAALDIKLTVWHPIDPILGMVFGIVLFAASINIIKDSFKVLLDSTPKDIDVDDISSDLNNIDSVENVHHIHAWTLTSGKDIFMAHIKINNKRSHEYVLGKATKLLKQKYLIYFSTLRVENHCDVDPQSYFIDYKFQNSSNKIITE
jgi:cobalt-zinc-cadmium efflux system protein